MNYNDILRKIRYTFDFRDAQMVSIFKSVEFPVTIEQVQAWLKPDGPDVTPINDKQLALFLNGFINLKRGKREGPPMKPEKRLNNNIILRKLKIALNLKDEDMIEIFKLSGTHISKHELSAFFRKPDQKQYRLCKDQYLRNFLMGLQKKFRRE